MNLDKAPNRRDRFANSTSRGGVRGYRSADRNAAVLRNFTCNIAYASNIQIAMFFRKAQFTRQVLANNVTVEKTHRTPTHFHELDHQCVRNRRLARPREAGKENSIALLVPRRMRPTKLGNNIRE